MLSCSHVELFFVDVRQETMASPHLEKCVHSSHPPPSQLIPAHSLPYLPTLITPCCSLPLSPPPPQSVYSEVKPRPSQPEYEEWVLRMWATIVVQSEVCRCVFVWVWVWV